MVKKTIMALLVCLIFAGIANAGCVVVSRTIMYLDAPRFYRVAQICAVNQEQCTQMMLQDVSAGLAVVMEPGTNLDEAVTVPDNNRIIMCRIGGVLLLGLSETVRCK
jgi:hypothetical protein